MINGGMGGGGEGVCFRQKKKKQPCITQEAEDQDMAACVLFPSAAPPPLPLLHGAEVTTVTSGFTSGLHVKIFTCKFTSGTCKITCATCKFYKWYM